MSLIVLIQKKKKFTTFVLTLYKLLLGSSNLLYFDKFHSLPNESKKVCDLSSYAQLGSLDFTSIYPQKCSASNLLSNQPNAFIYSAMEGGY